MTNNYLEKYDINAATSNELVERLVKVALEDKQLEFALINNIVEYNAIKVLRNAQRKFIKGFRKSVKLSYNQYINELKKGIDNLQLLSDIKVFTICKEFYENEIRTISDSLEEFEWYMLTGHLLEMLSGAERPYKDMYDSRKKQK